MNVTLKTPETDGEIKGKAYVHWKSWHEAYKGIVSDEYLDKLTLEKCEEIAFKWRENVIIAKDGESVIGFICYGGLTPEDSVNGGIVALYVLSEYYGKGVGLMLMNAAMEKLSACPKVGVWVLKENKRAIRFYEKCGFRRDGEEIANANISASEIRMIYQR